LLTPQLTQLLYEPFCQPFAKRQRPLLVAQESRGEENKDTKEDHMSTAVTTRNHPTPSLQNYAHDDERDLCYVQELLTRKKPASLKKKMQVTSKV